MLHSPNQGEETRYVKATEKTQTKWQLREEVKINLPHFSPGRLDAEVEKQWNEAESGVICVHLFRLSKNLIQSANSDNTPTFMFFHNSY